MDWNAFAQEVHQNAVENGFWEGERPIEEIFALIHSEWSEALEEYRANRPMVWYRCGHVACDKICDYGNSGCSLYDTDDCKRMRGKPEGIAVELVDGCIRILDFLAEEGTDAGEYAIINNGENVILINQAGDDDMPLPSLLCNLHGCTVHAMEGRDWAKDNDVLWLMHAIANVCVYLRQNGLDPEALMREKHEYNKTRPYKHGKKC